MKQYSPFISAAVILAATSSVHAAPVTIPDGNFNSGQGGWIETNGGDGSFVYRYPSSGGNPGNHGVIDNTGGGGWGIWVSNSNFPILLADLGLNAGEIYTFSQDMKILSGSTLGGFKIDFFSETTANGSTGDIFPALIGDGSTWETYNFDISIPTGTDGIKIVPLWGANSSVAFDNITADDALVASPAMIPDADFEAAGGSNWEQSSGGGTFVFNFPGTGGNPGGYGEIDHSANDGGWAVLVTSDGVAIPLSGIGLTAGQGYIFSQDMKIFSGTNLGGFKVDFFNGAAPNGSTGDVYPDLIGDGSTWETYDFQINIPESVTAIKVVPLWGPGSVVGYDNIAFSPVPIEVPDITEIPNGDFEDGRTSWAEGGNEHTTFAYETTGGNSDGYGVMTNDGEGYGIWVGNGGVGIPIAGLGLVAGETYTFKQDMRLLAGSEIGGLKVEFLNGFATLSDSGDMRVPLIGDGSTWETYGYQVSIPSNANAIKLVPLWGGGSSVAYDTFTINTEAIAVPPVLNPGFELGSANWEQYSGNGTTTFSFPDAGGNPGGFAQITNTDGWAVIVSNGAAIIPAEKFGIIEEGNYEFKMDMKIFAGTGLGGLKVEFYDDSEQGLGDSGELFPVLIGNGSTWETYTFEVFVFDGVTGIKVVPLWGSESTVGYDNIRTPGPAGFAGWISGFPGVGDQAGFDDDPDQDGQPNGVENFFGTDPSVSSQGLLVTEYDSGISALMFTHPRNADPAPEAEGFVYTWSTDLETFYPNDTENSDGTIVDFNATENPGGGSVTVEASVFGPVPEKIFVRLALPATGE